MLLLIGLTGRAFALPPGSQLDPQDLGGGNGVPWSTANFITTGSGYDLRSGRVVRTVKDFAVAGSVGGVPLEQTRVAYTQAVSVIGGVLGETRWVMNAYDYQVLQPTSLIYPSGSNVQFAVASTDGVTTWRQRNYGHDRVKLNPDNTIAQLWLGDGSSVEFSASRAVRIKDRHGLALTLTYGADGLAQVSDAAGRSITYTYYTVPGTTTRRLRRATGSDGQWAEYSWSDGARLIGVTYSDGTSASYSYTVASGAQVLPSVLQDTRASAKMQAVKYAFMGRAAGNPESHTALAVLSESDPGTNTLVTLRDPDAFQPRNSSTIAPFSETRGDGGYREVHFKYEQVVKVIGFAGDVTNIIYEGQNGQNNCVKSVSDGLGRVTQYVNEPVTGRVSKITYPDGNYREFTFSNAAHPYFVTTSRDELGRITNYTRYANGALQRIDYPDGSHESWPTLNSYNQPTSHRLRNGATEWWEFDSAGRLLKHYLPSHTTQQDYVEYTYYPDTHVWKDRVKTVRDPRGNVTTYEYDLAFVNDIQGTTPCAGRGLVTRIINPDNTELTFGYDKFGNKIWEENELRERTSYTFDGYQRLLTTTNALNETTTLNYTHYRAADGMAFVGTRHTSERPGSVTSPSGRVDRFYYLEDYKPLKTVTGYGTADASTVAFEYDSVGNLAKLSQQVDLTLWRVTTYGYDTRNRKRFEYAPLNRTTEWQYDAVGNVRFVINPDATSTEKTYNAMNQVATSVDEMGDTTSFTYNSAGLVHQLIDPRGKIYTNTYAAAGRLTKRQYPDATEENWDYDAAGNVDAYYNRSNQKQSYAYNTRNRETARSWQGDVAPTVSTAYYANGLVWTRGNGVSTTTNTYYATGALHTQQQAIASGPSVTLTFSYDADGRRQTFNGGTGRDHGYTYNARGGLHNVKNGGLSGTDLATYTYNLAEQRATRTSGNGIVATYAYDAAGRLNYLNAASVLRLDFGHDVRDRRTWTLRDQNLGDTYEYFNDSELYRYRHGVTRPDQNFNNPAQRTDSFDYDPSGNRLQFSRGGAVTSYTAGDDNRYTAVSGNTIAHDARGNVTTWDGKTFGYDADNRLISATATGLTMTFAYDSAGRLVKLVKNGVTEYRFYDGAQCFLRTDGNGTAIDWTVWGPTPDEVIARQVSGAWQFYHQDQINSVYAVTNAAGSVLERYLYDPFGLPDVRDANWGSLGTYTVIGNPWLFTGQEWRGDLSLSNYKARWYQPTLGRFLQNDPVRFDAGDVNLYRYCGNDPMNRSDPLGLADVILVLQQDRAFSAAESVPAGGDIFTVAVHGMADGGFAADRQGENTLSTRQVTRSIEKGGHEEGKPIQMIMCHAGAKPNLRAMKSIAKSRKSPVIAATKAVGVRNKESDGAFVDVVTGTFDKDGNITEKGEWIQVNPDGSVTQVTVSGALGEKVKLPKDPPKPEEKK